MSGIKINTFRKILFPMMILLFISPVLIAVEEDALEGTDNNNRNQEIGIYHYVSAPDSIQDAIDAANDNDTVLVRPGTYYPQQILVSGKSITVRSDADGDPTTIDVDPENTIIQGPSTTRVVEIIGSETSGSCLNGFTIRDGRTPDGSGLHGGAILCDQSSSHINNCIVSESTADGNGGGIACISCSPEITNCRIRYNDAADGGGIYCQNSFVKIYNCLIVHNSAVRGGGVCLSGRSTDMKYCTLSYNTCTVGNSGDIYNCQSSKLRISSSIIWEPGTTPRQIEGDVTSPISIKYSDVKGGWPGSIGIINADPLFVSVPTEQFYLQQLVSGDPNQSPCVDSAENDSTFLIRGTTRTDGVAETSQVFIDGTTPNNPPYSPFDQKCDMGYHYPAKYYDQNKSLCVSAAYPWGLYFDDITGNQYHDSEANPTNPQGPEPVSTTQLPNYRLQFDNSCWLASAKNLYMYENPEGDPVFCTNSYWDELLNGGAWAPNNDAWNQTPVHISNWPLGDDIVMTFDDGGFQDWYYKQPPVQSPPLNCDRIATDVQFFGKWNPLDPIAWCEERLGQGHPIGLAIWCGNPNYTEKNEAPAPKGWVSPYTKADFFMYHAITLWEIDTLNQTVTITDSDDLYGRIHYGQTSGYNARTLSYSVINDPASGGNIWKINNYLYFPYPPAVHDVTVNYAMCVYPPTCKVDTHEISLSANNEVILSLDAGTVNANRTYIISGSMSGTQIGVPLPAVSPLAGQPAAAGYQLFAPLNHDFFMDFVFANLNSWWCADFSGFLDSEGKGEAIFSLPTTDPNFVNVGDSFFFAFACYGPCDVISNPVRVNVVQ